MDKSSIMLLILFGILTLCSGIPLNADTKIETNKNSEVCETQECVRSAASILEKMDFNINPCDDFYEFACGNYIANETIPDGAESLNIFYKRLTDVQSRLHQVLTIRNNTELKVFQDLKHYYNLCVDEDLKKKEGNAPLFRLLHNLGGWPLLSGKTWKNTSFNWLDAMVKRRKLGLDHEVFISLQIQPDLKNSSKLIIHIGDKLSDSLLRNLQPESLKEFISIYLQYITNVAVILGADRTQASKDMEQVESFTEELLKLRTEVEEDVEDTIVAKRMSIRKLNKIFPTVPWKKLFNQLFGPQLKFSNNAIVHVDDLDYIHKLLKLLQSTPKQVQANYAMGRVIMDIARYLTKDIRNEDISFKQKMIASTAESNCITEISEDLPIAIGSLFIRDQFQHDTKKNVSEIITNIREAFYNMLKEADWMDEATKQKALEKGEAMTSMVAYPVEMMNDTLIEKYYAKLAINRTSYLDAHLSIKRFHKHNEIKNLRKPPNKVHWTEEGHVTNVNAFYDNRYNRIRFPAAFLNGATYASARPKYLNYGGMGSVVGHEITHGFDNVGQGFGKNGSIQDWWDPSTKEKFIEKTGCIVDQYNEYIVKEVGENINGILTLGENIADNGGIKAAYLAYTEWLNRNGNEPKLPGLNYTNRQMFWIGSTNFWCAKTQLDVAQLKIYFDEHSPEKFRVIGSLSNRPEFARDFDCPLGSKMNPIHKCSIW